MTGSTPLPSLMAEVPAAGPAQVAKAVLDRVGERQRLKASDVGIEQAAFQPERAAWSLDHAPRDQKVGRVAQLHSAHRLGRHCERTDHLAEMRIEAEREVEAQVDAMAALIRTVLRSLDLPDEIERRGLEVATAELRKLSAEYDE